MRPLAWLCDAIAPGRYGIENCVLRIPLRPMAQTKNISGPSLQAGFDVFIFKFELCAIHTGERVGLQIGQISPLLNDRLAGVLETVTRCKSTKLWRKSGVERGFLPATHVSEFRGPASDKPIRSLQRSSASTEERVRERRWRRECPPNTGAKHLIVRRSHWSSTCSPIPPPMPTVRL